MRWAHWSALNHVCGHRADHGPKKAPGMISNEGRGESRTAQDSPKIKPAPGRPIPPAQKSLTETAPLPKF
jgi:hypothetical protein